METAIWVDVREFSPSDDYLGVRQWNFIVQPKSFCAR